MSATFPVDQSPGLAPPTAGDGLRWIVADALVITRRNLSHIRHVPDKLLGITIQPIMFVLLFAYVFGSAIKIPGGGNYREFLMAGIFVQSAAFAASATAVGLADDLTKGLLDRFRSLPMARPAFLIGRTVADLIFATIGLAVMAACGLAVGWRMREGVLSAVAGFGLLLLFTYAFIWIFAYVGLIAKTPEVALQFGFIFSFPLTFLANTFVPTAGMPRALRVVADWNPVSAVTEACRQLFGNPGQAQDPSAWPLQHAVAASVLWSLLIIAVFLPLSVARYRATANR